MTKVSPYIILHIQLEKTSHELFQLSTEQNGYYLIFWWRNIPLGDLYIEAGQLFEEDILREKILKIISPATNFYLESLKLPQADYSKGFLMAENFEFAKTLNAVSSAYYTFAQPEVVDISVIICTRNRSGHLKNCLDSLLSLTCLPREIIVIDNAPSDNQTKELVDLYKNVKYCQELRKGLDHARNKGAQVAACSIIAYLDDDVLLHPFWALETWKSFIDPKISAITGLVFVSDLSFEAQQIFEKYWSFNRGYIDKFYDNSFFKATKMPPVWLIGAGANMAFRKPVLESTGYFDERLDVGAAGCNGDSEMWYRLLLNDHVIHYNPRVISYHSHRSDLPGLKKQMFNYLRGHIVASLIQQEQNKDAAYHKHVYWDLPRYYFLLLRCGFPSFSSRYCTLFSEIKGLFSGVLYFYQHRKRSPQTVQHMP